MLCICIGVMGQKEYGEYKKWRWSVNTMHCIDCFCHSEQLRKSQSSWHANVAHLILTEQLRNVWYQKKNTSLYLKNSAAYVSQPCTFTTGSGSECLIWLCPFSYQQQLLYYPSLAIGNPLVILCISIALKRTCNTSWQADNIKREQDEKMTNWQHHKRTRWQLSST